MLPACKKNERTHRRYSAAADNADAEDGIHPISHLLRAPRQRHEEQSVRVKIRRRNLSVPAVVPGHCGTRMALVE